MRLHSRPAVPTARRPSPPRPIPRRGPRMAPRRVAARQPAAPLRRPGVREAGAARVGLRVAQVALPRVTRARVEREVEARMPETPEPAEPPATAGSAASFRGVVRSTRRFRSPPQTPSPRTRRCSARSCSGKSRWASSTAWRAARAIEARPVARIRGRTTPSRSSRGRTAWRKPSPTSCPTIFAWLRASRRARSTAF